MAEDELDDIVEKRAKETGLTKGEVVKRYQLEKVGESPLEGGGQVPSTMQEFKEMMMAQSMREMMRPKKEGEGADSSMFNRLLLMRMLPDEGRDEKRGEKSTMDRLFEYKAMKDMFPREGAEGKEKGESKEKSTMDKILEYKLLRDTFGEGKEVPSDVMKRLDELRTEFLGKRVGDIEMSVKEQMDEFRELLTKGKRDEAVEALASRITSLDAKLDTAQTTVAGGSPSRSTVQVMSEALKEQREFQEEMIKFAESQGMTRAEMMKGGKVNWGKVMDRAFGLGEKAIERMPGRKPTKKEVIPIPGLSETEAPPEAPASPLPFGPAVPPKPPAEAEKPLEPGVIAPESPERPSKLGLWVPKKEKPVEAPPEQPPEAPAEKKPPEEKPPEEKPPE